jgi:hypothetical protein
MMIHMHPAQERHAMHALAATPAAAADAASPRSATLLHPSSAIHASRSRSSSRRSSPSRSRNGSFGSSAGLLLPIHLHPGSSSTCPISTVGLSPPPSPLKPFDPATASAKQLDLRAIETHMRITIGALDKARARFIRTTQLQTPHGRDGIWMAIVPRLQCRLVHWLMYVHGISHVYACAHCSSIQLAVVHQRLLSASRRELLSPRRFRFLVCQSVGVARVRGHPAALRGDGHME